MFIFEIFGDPKAQKQTQFNRHSGHAYDPSKLDLQQIQWQLKPTAPSTPISNKVRVCYHFYMPIPKSASKKQQRQMLNGVINPSRPDTSNLMYLYENAMKGIVYEDDRQVDDFCAHRRYSDVPMVVIKVIPIINVEQNSSEDCKFGSYE